jgi:hypothetical protein
MCTEFEVFFLDAFFCLFKGGFFVANQATDHVYVLGFTPCTACAQMYDYTRVWGH